MITSYLCTGIIYYGADDIGGIYKWLTKPLNLKEEENELERDICGFDTFGATKALFENDYAFHRYVQWSDLTEQEKYFLVKRVGYRSYLNLLSLFLFTKPNISIREKLALSGSFGYALAPFGDFIDENLFFKIRNTSLGDINIFFYARCTYMVAA